MKTKLTPLLLIICFITAIISCKKPDALDKETSKNLITTASNTPLRYRDSVFANVDSFPNIFYRNAPNFDKVEELKLDVYMPAGDTATSRACLIFMHGGAWDRLTPNITLPPPNYGSGTRKGQRSICLAYAKRGYVVISPSYRTGKDFRRGQSPSDSSFKFYEAVYRASQDARAMLRFVKKNAITGKINVNKIFIGGGSAGAGTAVHTIYLDQSEIGNGFSSLWGALDGTGIYDYPDYNLKVKGVINVEGAIFDKNYIDAGDPPMISSYGSEDQYYKDSVGVPLMSMRLYPKFKFDSGPKIHQRFSQLGIFTPPIILYLGKGHGANNDPILLKNTINFTSAWMYSLLQP